MDMLIKHIIRKICAPQNILNVIKDIRNNVLGPFPWKNTHTWGFSVAFRKLTPFMKHFLSYDFIFFSTSFEAHH